jgi:hypothetical protein
MKTTAIMNTQKEKLAGSIKRWIIIFIVGLVLSGVTAFPLETELSYLLQFSHIFPASVAAFMQQVYEAIRQINALYPYLAYGTDWLAFAHIVIAVAFIGPLRDPVKNIWVIEFGMISCLMVFPLAFICGPIRNIPFYWQLIDCSFGVFGIIPLLHVHRQIKKLAHFSHAI